MIYERALTSLTAAALAAGVVVPAAGAAPGAVAAPAAGPTVTLLTGDEVTVGGRYGVRVRPAEGRERIPFRVRTDGHGDTHVLPLDVAPLLAQGKLDPRLFDVTALVRDGYDDASAERLPLIVDFAGATPRVAGATVSRELPVIGAVAVSVERSAAFWPTARRAGKVWLDGPVTASLDRSVPRIGAPAAWAAGHTGEGATVAVLDTGIDATHPDLADAVAGARDFAESGSVDDRVGHGTHVAAIITGGGDRYRGVAPDARLLNGKVLDDQGAGRESWVLAGMEWAAGNGADVVNMSLGTPFPSDGTDPLSQAVNRITEDTGTLFVISSGNSGPGAGTVGAPGAAAAALTVGAVDRDDRLAGFSSRGPRAGDGGMKPDITAPGVGIVAARARNGVVGEPVGDHHVALSGTSMAAPHVAGAAAILAARHPDWRAERLKSTLMGSAEPNPELTVFEQGAGRVDVAAATTTVVSASPASVDVGVVQWPHDDDRPVAKTLTYTNSGTAPVTVDLAADITGPHGSAAPRGMFTIEPARLTVPAGGTADAVVTTDTRVAAADGQYSGVVTATGAGVAVRVPIAVHRETESYAVTMRVLGFDGEPTGRYASWFAGIDDRVSFAPWDGDGTVVTRMPKGDYYFDASVTATAGYRVADIVEPKLTIDRDTEIVVDARDGLPVGFTVDEPTAKSAKTMIALSGATAWGEMSQQTYLSSLDDYVVRPSITREDRFRYTVETHMARPNGPYFADSPYLYHLRHTDTGAVPKELRWRAGDTALATVRTEYARATPGLLGLREGIFAMRLPATTVEHYTPDVPWENYFYEVTDLESLEIVSDSVQSDPRVHRAGGVTAERWNVGVRGPAFPGNPYGAHRFAGRTGDRLEFRLPLTADQDPGRAGFPTGDVAMTLLRDGVVLGESTSGNAAFDVGGDRAEYTLRASHDRSRARSSTRISAEWTFTSGYTEEPEPLPLLAVRFAPELDQYDEAPAGTRFTIPVYVQRNGSGDAGTVATPAVEVSYDDGTTWRAAVVGRDHGRWQAEVDHPDDAGFVSLRSSVSDGDGNTQRQTVIRAYALK